MDYVFYHKKERKSMKNWEELLIWGIGKLLMVIGIGGMIIALFFDYFARGLFTEYGRLQCTGISIFNIITIIGYISNRLLMKEVMPIVKEYLSK